MKFYDAASCWQKADQHWEMAGLASQDGDKKDAARHTRLAQEWTDQANCGGCSEKEAPK
jgi:hypothetical protein